MFKISEIAEQTNEILSSHRNVANDAVVDVMMDAFQELGMLMAETERVKEVVLDFDKGAGGFQPVDLENVLIHFRRDDLAEWLMGLTENERISLTMKFLDYDRIRMHDFRARFPKAFMKWTPEEDSQLREMYAAKCSWRQMSEQFGRNTNALKLRLERLGYDLGSDAGRSRFHPAPADHNDVTALRGGSSSLREKSSESPTAVSAEPSGPIASAAAVPAPGPSDRPAAAAPAQQADGRSHFSGHVKPLFPPDAVPSAPADAILPPPDEG